VTAAEILDGIRELRVLVAGDICLDQWCQYDPSEAEPSRETGIPRLAVVETETTPGAAGTVANNLAALGAKHVGVLGVVGEDGHGYELERALSLRQISSELVIRSSEMPTFTYTKLINARTGIEDRPRVDYLYTKSVPESLERKLLDHLRSFWSMFEVVLVSDQAETERGGVITPAVRDFIASLARETPDKVVWVDSRVRGEFFRNVLLKCNGDEAEAACKRAYATVDFGKLRERIGPKPLIVTQGQRGALVVDATRTVLVPTRPVAKPVDICGAGDSFSAGAALALAVSGSVSEAARFGNLVSSITIMKKGTGTASPAEVIDAERNWTA
jgi:rfaE bifunctional protein kinase chain/domain